MILITKMTKNLQEERYILASNESGVYRLELLNRIHQPYTEFLLKRAGLEPGMVVADIGCGTGNVTIWLAQQIGDTGSIVGVDRATVMLEQGRRNADALRLNNIKFLEGNAYNTGLPHNSFDLVYCRFLLMHLDNPFDALKEMRSLLKPNGVLVCEEGNSSSIFCDPPSAAFDRSRELHLAISKIYGQDFSIGSRLHQIFQDVELIPEEVSFVNPLLLRPEEKAYLCLTFSESADALIQSGLTTPEESEQIINQFKILAADEKTVFSVSALTQIWARKQARNT